jgi:endonuclease YncB( thermonuclease family)
MLTLRSLFIPILSLIAGSVAPAPLAALDSRAAIEGVARVIDGDTLDIGAVRIRLHGIDAPERAERCRRDSGGAWACGAWATEQARRRYDGARLVCHDLGDRTHDRVVARCRLDGEDIALAMVRAGVVMACPRYALEHPDSAAYLDAEKEAAFARAGLHAGPVNPRAGFCALPGGGVEGVALRTGAGGGDAAHNGCAIKGNVNARDERIYHMPGQRDYAATVINGPDERMFCSEAEAVAAGWRPAQR